MLIRTSNKLLESKILISTLEVKFFEGLLLKTQWNKQVYYVYVELHKTHRRGGHIGQFFFEVFDKIRLLMILMR